MSHDNAIYKAEVDGVVTDHQKISGKYHVPGKLILVGDQELKELFDAAMPILRTARGTHQCDDYRPHAEIRGGKML